MKVLLTGSEGFIGGYIVKELLDNGHEVVGIDNLSKYGQIVRKHSENKDYTFHNHDVKDEEFLLEVMSECDYLIAGAAMIGGISYFHDYAYDLISENEKIISATTDIAIKCQSDHNLKRTVFLSSSMVFESSNIFPTKESDLFKIPPPISSYGFQKLSVEYFAKAANLQYGLEYSIARPFNCVGIGEVKATSSDQNSKKLTLSHVVPDLILKTLNAESSIEILGNGNQIRHYTYGEDLAKGIVALLEHPKAKNDDFNLSTSESTTVLNLAKMIWSKIHIDKPFKYTSTNPYEYDVQKRIPATEKARDLIGFEANTKLNDMLDIVIPWIKDAHQKGLY
ncbi:NAD(P)-dependent oxidoreductase [Acidimicrobiia bacterium]|jgi:UDP-glucose 4-epimerase|nr:NAD(P)-dependent oxidoreductase [Acidimicrobiia bacterium]